MNNPYESPQTIDSDGSCIIARIITYFFIVCATISGIVLVICFPLMLVGCADIFLRQIFNWFFELGKRNPDPVYASISFFGFCISFIMGLGLNGLLFFMHVWLWEHDPTYPNSSLHKFLESDSLI